MLIASAVLAQKVERRVSKDCLYPWYFLEGLIHSHSRFRSAGSLFFILLFDGDF